MIVVLLPAFNEVESLQHLVPKLVDTMSAMDGGYRIVVCDDDSTDGTDEALSDLSTRYPLEVITHRYNRGPGESVRDLFEKTKGLTGPCWGSVRHSPRETGWRTLTTSDPLRALVWVGPESNYTRPCSVFSARCEHVEGSAVGDL